MSASKPRPGRPSAATIRRRRLGALAVIVALAAAAVLAAWVGLGSGSDPSGPAFVPSGAGVSVLTVSQPAAHPRAAAKAPRFIPAPAAVSLAASLPLARQVAQLFVVSLDGTTSSAVAGLGSPDWGGVVFDASNFVSDAQLAARAGEVAAAARTGGLTAPLIAAAQAGGPGTTFPDLPPQAEPTVGDLGDPAVAAAQAAATARKLRALGFNMNLAPLADVDTPGGP